jgi:hypothetical protein
MKKVVLTGYVALASSLILSGCLPTANGFIKSITTLQTPLIAATPLPKFTATTLPTLSIDSSSTATLIPTNQFTPIPSFTPFVNPGFEEPSQTSSPTSLAVLLYDTVPPEVDTFRTSTPVTSVSIDKLPSNTVYKPVHVQNLSREQVDLTFQCTTIKGLETIIQYGNIKNLFTNLPEGNYSYVFFVGGRQLIGGFSFITATKLFIIIYKDRVAVH